jgi:hypothetical protein
MKTRQFDFYVITFLYFKLYTTSAIVMAGIVQGLQNAAGATLDAAGAVVRGGARGVNYATGGAAGQLAGAALKRAVQAGQAFDNFTNGRAGQAIAPLYNVTDFISGGRVDAVREALAQVINNAYPIDPTQKVTPADKEAYDDVKVRFVELHTLLEVCDERKNVFIPVSTLRHIIGKKKVFENVTAFDQLGQMDVIQKHDALADMMARAVANKEEYLDIDDLM